MITAWDPMPTDPMLMGVSPNLHAHPTDAPRAPHRRPTYTGAPGVIHKRHTGSPTARIPRTPHGRVTHDRRTPSESPTDAPRTSHGLLSGNPRTRHRQATDNSWVSHGYTMQSPPSAKREPRKRRLTPTPLAAHGCPTDTPPMPLAHPTIVPHGHLPTPHGRDKGFSGTPHGRYILDTPRKPHAYPKRPPMDSPWIPLDGYPTTTLQSQNRRSTRDLHRPSNTPRAPQAHSMSTSRVPHVMPYKRTTGKPKTSQEHLIMGPQVHPVLAPTTHHNHLTVIPWAPYGRPTDTP